MGQVIQLQGDQRKVAKEFLESKDGLDINSNTIKVCNSTALRSGSCLISFICRSTDFETMNNFYSTATSPAEHKASRPESLHLMTEVCSMSPPFRTLRSQVPIPVRARRTRQFATSGQQSTFTLYLAREGVGGRQYHHSSYFSPQNPPVATLASHSFTHATRLSTTPTPTG
jgi:hypothetical protein